MRINKKYNQKGIVSIMIASVMMIIMALITLGFTRLVQNEQRQAIDNQLSQQAFYAAESGINIAASDPDFPGERKDDCDVSGYNNGVITDELDENGNPIDVVFTCLLIDPRPSDLVFGNDSITTNRSKVVPIRTSSEPERITFQWKGTTSATEANCNVGSMDFDINDATWNKIALLKLDLVGIPSTTPFTREDLAANQFSVVFYPCANGGSNLIAFMDGAGEEDIGKIVPVNCVNNPSVEYPCEIDITLGSLTAARGVQREYFARFNSIYNELNVRITALDLSGNTALFAGAQAVVDSTGRANDVFHRLQARVPLYENYALPAGTIHTLDDICKLYEVRETEVIDNCN
jgi:hypothetical protein